MNTPSATASLPRTPSEVFRHIYESGVWHRQPWNSGNASDPNGEGAQYVSIITAIIKIAGIKSVADLGTGDGRIIAAIASNCPGLTVTGYDCCYELIEKNRKAMPHHYWMETDIENFTYPLNCYLILLKDVLHHWPSEMIVKFFSRLKHTGQRRTFIITQDREQAGPDADCELGGYRALNYKMYPLAQFKPRHIVDYQHKSMLAIDL